MRVFISTSAKKRQKLPIAAFHLVGFASDSEAENLIVPHACRITGF